MSNRPFVIDFLHAGGIHLSQYDHHIVRKLSSLRGQFLDQEIYEAMLRAQDPILYEVYEVKGAEVAGELIHGITIIHPGKVGTEYFMTKGHYHLLLDTAEVYYCLQGQGSMVMETPEGDWAVEPLRPQSTLYVPPRWAHRTVNTSPSEDLVIFFVYPGNAGHDYGTIEKQGYRKLVVERDGKPEIIDNLRWLPPEKR